MPLILAVEPDRQRAATLRTLIERLGIDLALGDATHSALADLAGRTPDLVLTSSAISPGDEAGLIERLREFDAAGAHAQTLVIPDLRAEEESGTGGRSSRRDRGAGGASAGIAPGDFGKHITDALERGAAERAALAAAQAELDAVWAGVATASPATIDVHPGMVVDDPDALFGEFAAIPIRPAEEPPRADLGFTASRITSYDAHADQEGGESWAPPAAGADVPPREEEWEEIALDALDAGGAVPAASADRPVATHDVEAADGNMDLEAFVDELKTIPSTANAQPMIPVIDLRHLESITLELPSPVAVAEEELRQEEAALVTAEIRAVFAPPESAQEAAACSSSPSVEAWRAHLDLLPSPPLERPQPVHQATPTPTPTPAWGDLLSAIRRDIGSPRTEDPAANADTAGAKGSAAPPLVFPSRSAAAARVLAAIECGTAERRRPETPAEARPQPAAPRPEAALAALLQSVQSRASAPQGGTSLENGSTTPPDPLETAPEFTPEVTPALAPEPETALLHPPDLPASPHPLPNDRALSTPRSAEVDNDAAASDTRLEAADVEHHSPSICREDGEVAVGEGEAISDPLAWLTVPPAHPEAPHASGDTDALTEEAVEATPERMDAAGPALSPPPAGPPVGRDAEGIAPRPVRSKGSRKRKSGRPAVAASPEPPPIQEPTLPTGTADWGFLDAQADGFMSLLATLNAVSAARSVQPLR